MDRGGVHPAGGREVREGAAPALLLSFLSRAALSAPFVQLGLEAAKEPGKRVIAAEKVGIPAEYADAAVRLNGATMVLGGLAVVTGVQPRLGALAVIGSLVPTTIAGHPFWNDTDPVVRQNNKIQVLKNIGLAGGLLAVAVAPRRRG